MPDAKLRAAQVGGKATSAGSRKSQIVNSTSRSHPFQTASVAVTGGCSAHPTSTSKCHDSYGMVVQRKLVLPLGRNATHIERFF